MSLLPLFFVIPLAAAFLIPLLSRLWKGFADLLANLATASVLGLAIYCLLLLKDQVMLVYKFGGWPPPFGIVFGFDSLSGLMVLVIGLVSFTATIFSIRYLDHYTARARFYTLFMLCLAGMNGVAITGDIFNLFVFLEIAAISSYALVAFGTEHEELEASFKYMVMGEVASLSILLAIALLYARASTLNMADLSLSLQALGRTPFSWFIIGIFLFSFGVKAAAVPFHAWLPDAHPAAPAPVSAILSGVFIKVLGVYTLARISFNVFNLSRGSDPVFFNLLLGLGLLSIIAGGLLALRQRDYKRLLAYSTISQVGYIILGLGIGNYWGVAGALFHILAHGIGKGLLFLTSGSVVYRTGTRDLEQLKNLEGRMRVTGWSYIIGSLSLAGLPPLIGFFSKFCIILGAIQAGFYWVAVVAIVFSVLTLAYLLKIQRRVFFTRYPSEALEPEIKEVPWAMRSAMLILAVLSVMLGLGFQPILKFIITPAAQALLRGADYARFIFGG
jgi:multicomponent Na+:H+ antiporter subunit D